MLQTLSELAGWWCAYRCPLLRTHQGEHTYDIEAYYVLANSACRSLLVSYSMYTDINANHLRIALNGTVTWTLRRLHNAVPCDVNSQYDIKVRPSIPVMLYLPGVMLLLLLLLLLLLFWVGINEGSWTAVIEISHAAMQVCHLIMPFHRQQL